MRINRSNRSGPKRKLGTGPECRTCTEADLSRIQTGNGWNNGSSNLRRRYSLSAGLRRRTSVRSSRASGISRRRSLNKRHPHGIIRMTVQIGSRRRRRSSADNSSQLDADQRIRAEARTVTSIDRAGRMAPIMKRYHSSNYSKMHERTCTVPTTKSFSSARVKVKIRGRNVMTLLDTGSGTNLLERKYVHPRDLRPSQQSVRAANGSKIRIVGEATVSMQVGVKTYRVPVLVTDQMSGLTLGLPWLRRYHLIWKLCDNWVTLDNQIVDLYTSTTENECRRVEVDTTRQEISPASSPAPQKPTVETTRDEEKEAGMDDRQRQPLLWT